MEIFNKLKYKKSYATPQNFSNELLKWVDKYSVASKKQKLPKKEFVIWAGIHIYNISTIYSL